MDMELVIIRQCVMGDMVGEVEWGPNAAEEIGKASGEGTFRLRPATGGSCVGMGWGVCASSKADRGEKRPQRSAGGKWWKALWARPLNLDFVLWTAVGP